MKNLSSKICSILFSCVALASFAHAADTSDSKFSARVKVNVMGDANIKGTVSSYFHRELRSLGDVEIVDKDPEWTLDVLAMELKLTGGATTGVAISTVISRAFVNDGLSMMLQPKFKEYGLEMTSGLTLPPAHWLNVAGRDDAQKLSRTIVADFDTLHLEETRKVWRNVREVIKKYKQ